MSVVKLVNGTWADVDSLLEQYNNRVKLALYNTQDEVLAITAGTPESPGTYIDVVTGTTPENVTYTDDLTIGAVVDQELNCSFSFSVTSSVNNVTVTGFIYVNGVAQVQKVLRKIATGADVGAMSFNAVVPVKAGDVIGFYFDSSANTNLTVKSGASWVFDTFRIS